MEPFDEDTEAFRQIEEGLLGLLDDDDEGLTDEDLERNPC